MPKANPQANYAAQGATAQHAAMLSKQHAQAQPRPMMPQRTAPAPAGRPAAGPGDQPRGGPADATAVQPRAPQSVQLTPNDYGPTGLPQGDPDDMAFLYGDPAQGQAADVQTLLESAQAQNYSRETPVPTRLLRYLPILRQMAYDQDAPASVRAYYRHAVESIERRRQN